jgi:hypothetical protein
MLEKIGSNGANGPKQLQDNSDATLAPVTFWGNIVQRMWFVHEGTKSITACKPQAQYTDPAEHAGTAKPNSRAQ